MSDEHRGCLDLCVVGDELDTQTESADAPTRDQSRVHAEGASLVRSGLCRYLTLIGSDAMANENSVSHGSMESRPETTPPSSSSGIVISSGWCVSPAESCPAVHLPPAFDEEDVAISAFQSFCERAARGQFPKLNDRNDLWRAAPDAHDPQGGASRFGTRPAASAGVAGCSASRP